jgi:site-specific DNA-adenine methylase
LTGGLPIRWNAAGGDSAKRYQSAASSIPAFRRWLRRCTFTSCDAFDFLADCKDHRSHGIYVDAPWPEVGDKYRHQFKLWQQERLAARLAEFTNAKVVVRFGDHPLIRQLYPEHLWTWRTLTGRNQSNGETQEVLLVNNPLRDGDAHA